MDGDEDAENFTVTVALELDDGSTETPGGAKDKTKEEGVANSTPSTANFAEDIIERASITKIGPRTTQIEACPRVANSALKLKDLSVEATRLLELRLNPHAVGTLKNWEFICAHLGASIEEIASLRNASSPTAKMLHMFCDLSLKQLLDVLCVMNRVDVLISITKHIENMKQKPKSTLSSRNANGFAEKFRYSQMETVALTSGLQNSCGLDDVDYILLLHHESSREKKKYFKYLRENFRHQCQATNDLLITGGGRRKAVMDVRDCMDELNVYDTGERLFNRAATVVVLFSADYVNEVVNYHGLEQPTNSKGNLLHFKMFLHRLTDREYLRNGMRNRRFRAVMLPDMERDALPNGWAVNTLIYNLPTDYNLLCQKLFGVTATQQTTSTTTTALATAHNNQQPNGDTSTITR